MFLFYIVIGIAQEIIGAGLGASNDVATRLANIG
jgi:hypothetical protein